MRRSIGFFSVMLVLALPVLPACGCVGSDGSIGLCEGGGPTGPPAPVINVAGTWDGVITVTGGTQAPAGTEFSVTFTLAQSGTEVTGTFAIEGGLSGQLTGTKAVAGPLTFSVAQGEPCPGTFNGSGGVSSFTTQNPPPDSWMKMSGSYSGVDCSGTLESSFEATRR